MQDEPNKLESGDWRFPGEGIIPDPPEGYERVELKEGDPRPERYMFRSEGFCRGMWMEGMPALWGRPVDAEHAAKIANGTIAYARPIRKEQP